MTTTMTRAPARCKPARLFLAVVAFVLGTQINSIWMDQSLTGEIAGEQQQVASSSKQQQQQQHDANTSVVQQTDFALASQQSFGFFDNIPSLVWERKQKRARRILALQRQAPRGGPTLSRPLVAAAWIGSNWLPSFVCEHEDRLGDWFVCDPYRIGPRSAWQLNSSSSATIEHANGRMANENSDTPTCLVYGFADPLKENDVSMELDLVRMLPHCEVHVFGVNRTATTSTGVSLHEYEKKLVFHNFTLGPGSGNTNSNLESIVDQLGHTNRTIDVLRMERPVSFRFYQDVLELAQPVRQFLFQTNGGIRTPAWDDIQKSGYVVTHKDHLVTFPTGCRWTFLLLAREFWGEERGDNGHDGGERRGKGMKGNIENDTSVMR